MPRTLPIAAVQMDAVPAPVAERLGRAAAAEFERYTPETNPGARCLDSNISVSKVESQARNTI
jgi:hypothetical protein